MAMLNQEEYFANLPKVNIGRSIMKRPFNHKTSFDVGQVIPIYVDEVLPGSTLSMKLSSVTRLQTLLTPVMDNAYMDVSAWFCPTRILDDHWVNICGQNDDGPWTRGKTNYPIPVINYPYDLDAGISGFQKGSLADYMGVPIGVRLDPSTTDDRNFPMAYPFRAYAKIINEFWRDQNYQQPVVVHTDSTRRNAPPVRDTVTTVEGTYPSYITDLELGGKPFTACRFHGYFSSVTPAPQKSDAISIFGTPGSYDPSQPWNGVGPFAPVVTRGENAMKVTINDPVTSNGNPWSLYNGNIYNGVLVHRGSTGSTNVVDTNSNTVSVAMLGGSNNDFQHTGWYPSNLWANLNIPEATISNLRMAFQLQKYYEKESRAGTRYREWLMEMYGTYNGDARLQIPEYLGGYRVPLTIHQVANTGKSDSAALGDLGAMSNTSDVHDLFHHSFSEFGYLLVLVCVRYDNTFSQGLERFWSRRDILDFYNPVFAHISDQPIYKREIFLGNAGDDTQNIDAVWGYNEPWLEYRLKPSRVSSEMRPEVTNTLASWHFADDYSTVPTMGEDWITVSKANVDRTLAVTSLVSNQVFGDFFFDCTATLPMPVHSIPGFADHF